MPKVWEPLVEFFQTSKNFKHLKSCKQFQKFWNSISIIKKIIEITDFYLTNDSWKTSIEALKRLHWNKTVWRSLVFHQILTNCTDLVIGSVVIIIKFETISLFQKFIKLLAWKLKQTNFKNIFHPTLVHEKNVFVLLNFVSWLDISQLMFKNHYNRLKIHLTRGNISDAWRLLKEKKNGLKIVWT